MARPVRMQPILMYSQIVVWLGYLVVHSLNSEVDSSDSITQLLTNVIGLAGNAVGEQEGGVLSVVGP